MRATAFFRRLMMKDLKYKLRTLLAIFVAFVAVFVVNAEAAEAAWKFVVYGDTRSDDSAHRSVLSSIAQNTPDYRFIINVGDVVEDGASASQWNTWQNAVNEILGGTGQNNDPPAYMAAAGNHDNLADSSGSSNWQNYLPGQQRYGNNGAFFVFDYEDARFIFLNSTGSITGSQLDMLHDAIDNNPQLWLFAVWHHPIFPFGTKSYEDVIHDNWGVPLYEGGADIIFAGHAHYYVRSKKLQLNGQEHPPEDSSLGTVQVITGNGGAPLAGIDAGSNGYMMAGSTGDYGYTELTVDGNTLYLRHINENGAEVDAATYSPNPKSGGGGDTVDAGTLNNKIMAGYQGWFNAAGDGAGRGWRHWGDGSANTPNADNITVDMWPDLREYDADELYSTDFKYSNGSTAGLYSAYTPKTVERHLKWMQDYGIDGVFVQRFIGEATGSFRGMRDRVLQNVRAGAEKYGRVFANMYDISGGDSGSLVDDIKNDWMHLVDDLEITASSRYLHHNGRPVLSIWGFNTNGRPGSASQALELIRWLTTAAPAKYRATVKLGVDDDWRTDSADWQQAYRSADIISPWAVGRYVDNSGADNFRNNKIEPDLADLNGANIDYMPVVFPGFSWWNLKGEKFNHIKRNGGRFFWHQFYNAIDAGCNMVYVAMFDEVDEGTAIYKVAENDNQTPTTGRFVTLDEDGEILPSDWYLRLTGEATKMLRNQIGLTSTIPLDPQDAGSESNQKPQADAGSDQTVAGGAAVALNGGSSSDPDGSIVSYLWEQIDGTSVTLSNFRSPNATFVAPPGGISGDSLNFRITVTDDGGLIDSDATTVEVTRDVVSDSDGDGVPDQLDEFPYNADEYVDTDKDGEGNNADTDDDNDGMPDDWELAYGLNPLEDDAASDPDGDDISNINEYNLGTAPNHYEGNLKPEAPALLVPESGATVSWTPRFETGEFSDPNVNDDHSRTQWVVMRTFDDVCVFDVTSNSSLTRLTLPRHILEENTAYIWKARFIDSHNTASEWSEERQFNSGLADYDTNKDGVADVQEVSNTLDLDADGTVDIDQTDIKCVSMPDGADQVQICISIKDAQNIESIVSLEVQDPVDAELNSATNGKPKYFEFGLLDFKLLVSNPADETTVTIYLSRPAYIDGDIFKYDPVNEIWLDYSGYAEFSAGRREISLTLKDGGFGDADGIENGIIVDPLALGSDTDPGGGGSGSSAIDKLADGILPNDFSCFIATAAAGLNDRRSGSLGHTARRSELLLVIVFIMLGLVGKAVVAGGIRNRNL